MASPEFLPLSYLFVLSTLKLLKYPHKKNNEYYVFLEIIYILITMNIFFVLRNTIESLESEGFPVAGLVKRTDENGNLILF